MSEGRSDGDRWKDGLEDRIDKLETSVDGLLAWRNWILGTVAGIGVMTGAFAKQIAIFIRNLGS